MLTSHCTSLARAHLVRATRHPLVDGVVRFLFFLTPDANSSAVSQPVARGWTLSSLERVPVPTATRAMPGATGHPLIVIAGWGDLCQTVIVVNAPRSDHKQSVSG